MAHELVCLKGKIFTDLENVSHMTCNANYCAFSLSLPFSCPNHSFKEKKSMQANPSHIAILLVCFKYLDLFKFQSEWVLLYLFHLCLL